ncbi:MAG: hypothetical protein AB1782_07955, partial [Cyanobacteriota bacterium]
DMINGVANLKKLYSSASISEFKNKYISDHTNTAAHEFAHIVLEFLKRIDPQEYKNLEDIFNSKESNGRYLDHYSSLNIDEYFAVGYETYIQTTKPHKYLIDENANDSKGSTKASLKRKDPKLYCFVEHIINKYGNSKVNCEEAVKTYLDKLQKEKLAAIKSFEIVG